jgi:hypothetical protein
MNGARAFGSAPFPLQEQQMAKLIGKKTDANGIVEQWFDNGDDTITVQRSDDAQEALDRVARANLDGLPTIDGLGKPVIEVPLVEAMAWAEKRGIPWEKLLYSNEYDDQFKRFAQDYSKLQYRALKSVHTVQ